MNLKIIALGVAFLAFADLNAYVIWQHGYLGFWQQALGSAATIALLVDLVIALSLILFWMQGDARARGYSVLPYALLTIALGSLGPLAYLIRREWADRRSSAHAGTSSPARATQGGAR
jgi:hypothetical protein